MSSKEAIARIERQFTSGNSVPVERASVRAEDWEVLKSELAARDEAVVALREALDNVIHADGPENYDHWVRVGLERLRSPVTQAAVNRVRADAVEAAMQKIIDEANAEDEMERSASLFDATFILEDYANKLRNGKGE